jgi:hypothetical protein
MNRTELFLKAAEKLRADFEESRVIKHPGIKGYEAEGLVRTFLDQRLPGRFKTGSGFIVDHQDGASRQTDIIVYDALNCPVYRLSETGGVFPSNNVAATIEVKSTLNKAELEDAWQKIASVKALHKTSDVERGQRGFMHSIGIVFAFDCATSTDAILENYKELLLGNEFEHHVDAILILDQAVLNPAMFIPHLGIWLPVLGMGPGHVYSEGTHFGVSALTAGRRSLDLLFRQLLGYLAHFRHHVDHPGLSLANDADEQALQYLRSVTHETDPARREERLKEYRGQVQENFEMLNRLLGPESDLNKSDSE